MNKILIPLLIILISCNSSRKNRANLLLDRGSLLSKECLTKEIEFTKLLQAYNAFEDKSDFISADSCMLLIKLNLRTEDSINDERMIIVDSVDILTQ